MKEGNKTIDIIISKLDSNSLDLRLEGIKQLSQIDSPEVVEHFIRLLRDTSSEIQIKSAEALIKYKDRRSVPQLIETLEDGNKEVKKRVIYVLGEIKDKSAVLPLIKKLSDPRGEIRREAIKALGKLGDESAVEPLINVLEDENRYVRQSAVEVLGELGDERALEPIIARLSDNSVDVKLQALKTLGELEDSRSLDDVLKLFKDPNPKVRKEAVGVAGIIGDDRAIESYLILLKDEVLDVRIATINALSDINDQRSIENLISMLSDTNWKIRVMIITALKKLGVYDTIEKIYDICIKDKNPEVRKVFLEFLGNSYDERFIEKVTPLINDENWEVRLGLVKYYQNLSSEQVIAPLLDFLNDANTDVRLTSIKALGNISSEKSAETLIEILEKTEESIIKIEIINAIDNIGNIVYIEKLKSLMKDEDPVIREKTAHILKKNNLLNFEHFFDAAKGYFREGKYTETIDCIRKIEEYDENDTEMLKMKAISLYKIDDINNAEFIFLNLNRSGNADDDIYNYLGNIELSKDNTEKALEYFERIDMSDRNNTQFLKKIASSFKKQKNIKKAYYYFHKVFLIEPEDVEANMFLFKYFSQTSPETALDYFERIMKTGHIEKSIFIEAAWIAWKNGWAEKSMKICRLLEEKGMFDQTVSYIYSMFFMRNNMVDEALLYIEKIDFKVLIENNQDMFTEFFNTMLESSVSANLKELIKNSCTIIEEHKLVEYLEKLLSVYSYSEWYELYKEIRAKFKDSEILDLFILKVFLMRKDYALFEKNSLELEKKYGKENISIISIKADYYFLRGKYDTCLENYEKIKDLMNISQRDNYSKALQYTGNFDKAVREMEILIQNTGESDYEYRLAELFISIEKLEKASDIVRNLMIKYPENPWSYSLLGKIYYMKKDYSEALSCFKRSLDIDRKNTVSMNGLANIYIDKGVFEEAWIMLNEIKSLTGEDKEYFNTLIHYYQKQNKWNEVLKAVNRFETENPDTYCQFLKIIALFETFNEKEAYELFLTLNRNLLDDKSLFKLAKYLYERSYTEDSAKILEQLVEKENASSEVIYYYSMIDFDYAEKNILQFLMRPQYKSDSVLLNTAYINAIIEKSKFEEANIRLEELVLKHPENSHINYLYGKLLYLTEKTEKAIEKLEKSIILDTKDPKPYFILSKIFRKKGNYNKALSYMKTLQNNMKFELSVEYALEIANLYDLLEKHNQALEVIKKVSLSKPENTELEYLKGIMLFKNLLYKESSEIFENLIIKYPDNADYYKQSGKCFMKLNNFTKAVSALRRSITIKEDVQVRRNLAVSLHRAGMYNEAYEFFESLRGEDSLVDDNTMYYYFAENLFKRKDFNNSLIIVNRLINNGKRNNELLLLGARIYSMKENYEKALYYYEMIEDFISKNSDLILEYSDILQKCSNEDKSIFMLEKGSINGNKEIYNRLSENYMNRGMYDEALNNIELVLSEEPENSSALNIKGTILEKQEKYDNSIEAYEKANNYFKLGTIYTKLHDYDKALKYFNKLLIEDKNDFEANCFKAIIFKETGEYEKAIELLTNLENLYPDKTDTFSLLGAIYELIDDTKKAEEYYLKMIKSDINVLEAEFKVANLYIKQDKKEKAKEHFNKVLDLDPDNVGALSELANINRDLGNMREASKLYSMLIEKIPDYIQGYIELAKIYIENKKFNESILLLKNLGENDEPHINYLLAKTYFLAGENESANNYIRKAISRNNRYTDAYILLSEISMKAGKIEDSEFSLKKALDINPLDRKIYINLVRILCDRERFEEAQNILNDYSKKFADSSDDEDYLKANAFFYKKSGNIEKASEYLSMLEHSDDEEFLYEYGENLFISQKYDEALNIFKQYIKKDIKNSKVLHYMASIYFDKEKYDSIINLLEFSAKEMELNWTLYLDLGKACFFKKDYDKALDNLRKSISQNPNNPDSYYYSGKIYSIRKKYQESINFLEKSVLMKPDNYDAQFELSRSYRFTRRYNDSVAKLQQLLNNENIRIDVRKELGFIYQEMKMNDKALDCFREIYNEGYRESDVVYSMSVLLRDKDPEASLKLMKELEIDPMDEKDRFYEICELLIKNNEFDEAEKKLKTFIEKNNEDYKAYFILGKLYAGQELNGDAIKYFEKSVLFNPACYECYFMLAKLVGDEKAKLRFLEKFRSYDSENEEAEFFYMELLEKNNKEEEAYRIAIKFLDYDLDDVSKLISMAKVFFKSRDFENAENCIRKASDIKVNDETIKIMSDILFEREKYEEALEGFRELIDMPEQDYSYINKRIADCCLKLGNIQEGIKYYKKALQMNPEYWDAYTGLSKCYEMEGLYDEALSIIENILTYYPNREDVLFRASEICEKSEKLIEASAYLKKLLKLNPDNNEANFRLAFINFIQENYKASIDILGNILGKKLTVDFEKKVRILFSDIFIKLENFDGARKELEKVLEYEPENLYILKKLALCHENNSRYDEALRIYQEIILKDKTMWDVYLCAGDIYFRKGYLDKALAYYREALKFNNTVSEVYSKIAQVFEDKQILDKAISYYKEAIKVDSSWEKPYHDLASIYVRQGMSSDAIELYEKLIRNSPENTEGLFRLSKIYSRKKEYDKSLEVLEKLVNIEKNNPAYHLELAKVYHVLGKVDEAISESIRVVNIASIDSLEAREAQEMLKPEGMSAYNF